jgi:NAD+ kinase
MTLEVSINGEKVSSYVCDGLIVSTPTGSTGHSLSAGGPILEPEAGVLIINLICPHALSSRPVVVPDNRLISVFIAATSGKPRLSVDGQVGETLKKGECAQIRRSAKSVTFIHLPGYSYFSLLRQKLHWRGSNM